MSTGACGVGLACEVQGASKQGPSQNHMRAVLSWDALSRSHSSHLSVHRPEALVVEKRLRYVIQKQCYLLRILKLNSLTAA